MHEVILVDENDNEVGTGDKIKTHQEGKLHRAFSIFVFNSKGELLLQKRVKSKYHSGGLWTNTCCSHPRPGEHIEKAVHRRLREEMGFDCDLREVTNFTYKAELGELTEHEFDHVFIGFYDGEIRPDENEVDDFKFVTMDELRANIAKNPENYTAWFLIAMKNIDWNSLR